MKTLKHDIGITLFIKLSLLILLWWVCFHHPKHPINIEKQFFSSTTKYTGLSSTARNLTDFSR